MTLLLQSQAAHVCLSFHLPTKGRKASTRIQTYPDRVFGGEQFIPSHFGMLGLIS